MRPAICYYTVYFAKINLYFVRERYLITFVLTLRSTGSGLLLIVEAGLCQWNNYSFSS